MKILLLSLAMLTTSANLFAQLYVTPNGASSTDSYIYVDDEVLFVEQDVNLVANTNDPTTEASIYLRNEAQLVQGTTASANSGTGFISVIQNSNSDAYDYNFWASPVGNMSGIGNRNFGMARINDSLSLTSSTVALTTPGYNGASSPLTISTRWLYRWIPSTQRWSAIGTGNNTPVGYGFIMKGTDVTLAGVPETQNQQYDFRGRPNNGDIVMPVQTGVNFTDGIPYDFTLTGNPYPSALDLNLVFNDIDNGEINSFRYWDEDRTINSHYYVDNKGGYGTWIPGPGDPYATGGVYTAPTFIAYDNGGNPIGGSFGFGVPTERLFAPVGQGFMVVANSTGSITIKNSHRVYQKEGAGNNSTFRNPISGDAGIITGGGDPTDPYLNLTPQIRVQTYFNEGTHFRDMLLLFSESSTDGYDRGLDASHPMDGAVAEAYFKIGDGPDTYMNLVIQTVPFEPYKQVPIAFTLEEEMKFVVKVVEQINTPFGKAYLYDSSNGSYQEITAGEDAVLFLPTGTYEDRFFITFRGDYQDRNSGPIATAQNELAENVDFLQNNPIAQLEISNPEGYNIRSVSIFDMGGKLILTRENLGTQSRLSFPTANFSDGIYLVKLSTVDNLTLDYKITVFNK
jgi:hypothetical protein